MCVIIYAPAGATIKSEEIRQATTHNPDGYGFALYRRGKWHVIRSTTATGPGARWSGGDLRGPVVFHARISSGGGVMPGLIHPFALEHTGALLFHNGVIGNAPRAGQSDTAALAAALSSHSAAVAADILDFLAAVGGGRFALCLPGRAVPYLAGTFTRGADGVKRSNSNHLVRYYAGTYGDSGRRWTMPDED